MKFTDFKFVLILVLALALVIAICIKAVLFSNPQQHYTILDKLQKIDTNSVDLNEHIFKVQQGILRHYDGIIGTVDMLKQQAINLRQYQSELEQQELARLVQVLIKLGESVEQFLSSHAVLNNSLAYLPVIVNEFSSSKGVQRDQAENAHQLLEQLFLYNHWHQLEHKKQIARLIEILSVSSNTEENNQASDLKMIVLHAQVFYKNTEQRNQASNAIFSADVRAIVSTIRQQYMDCFSEQRELAEYLNWMIYFIAFILLLVTFNFCIANYSSARKAGVGQRAAR